MYTVLSEVKLVVMIGNESLCWKKTRLFSASTPRGKSADLILAIERLNQLSSGAPNGKIRINVRNGNSEVRKHRVEQELLADFRRVAGKTGLLFRVAEASVERPDGIVRDVIFPAVGGERVLHELVNEYKATGPGYRRKFHR